ncbi:MAG: EAL domain-containing protein [Gammaproteobacteria bacterium]|nr:EAL domain-containing protein [Gammaproteobacteria bacterium]MBU1415683.1 EAL domain-containing protein [Gammaproteobacteria bacterium]
MSQSPRAAHAEAPEHPGGIPDDAQIFRYVVDNAIDGFFIIDAKRRFIQVNDALCEMLGVTRSDMLGKTPLDFVAEESHPELIRQMGAIESTERRRYRVLGQRPDGSKFPLFLNNTSFKNELGAVAGSFGFVTDLTSLVEAQQAVAASERELQRILANMQDTYYRTDTEGRIVRASRSVKNLLGYQDDEVVGMRLSDLYYDPRDREDFLRAMAESGGALTGYESRLRYKDGHEVWVRTNAQYLRDADGNVVGVEGTTRDNTEHRYMLEALRFSEGRLASLIEALPDAVFLKDGEGRWQVVNTAGVRLFRLMGADWRGKDSQQIADMRPDLTTEMIECRLSDEAAWQNRGLTRNEEKIFDADGCERHWEFVKLPMFNPDGSRRALVVVARDLTEQRRVEENLRLAAQVFENSGEAIIIMDAHTRIVSANRAYSDMTGYLAEEVLGKPPAVLDSDLQPPDFYQRLWSSLRETGYWQGEIWSRRRNGEVYPEWLGISSLRGNDGEVTHFVAISSDISERKASEARIEFLAHHDPLTDLPNRLLLRDRLERAIAQGERSDSRVALLFLDLDRFKTVNDSLGHPVGDRLLREAAQRLRECVREMDTVSRQGGDEFLIVLTELKEGDAVTRAAESILAALSRPFSLDGHEVAISCSVGVAVYPEDGRDFDELLKKSDIAMYHAKEAGRNAFRYYTERMNIDALERLDLQNRLRRGLERDEFVLHYQPVVELASGRIVGAEALVRWNSPEEGLVMPGRFIAVAEESGLIVPLGDWVLREACRQLRRWHDAGHDQLFLAVNLSAIQFRRGSVEDSVTRALRDSGTDPRLLELELTESILLQGAEHVLASVRQLKSLGVKLSIDDFGTGYSSLAYLKRFAVDKLKIDQSFVRGLPADADNAAIVGAVVQMAKSLKLEVLAEGVEGEQAVEHLRKLQCDYVQGYHFGRPLPVAEFDRLLD